jgi:hypothetical protein
MNNSSLIAARPGVLILMSTPQARIMAGILYANRNLACEYNAVLCGLIHSYMILGILICILGLVIRNFEFHDKK